MATDIRRQWWISIGVIAGSIAAAAITLYFLSGSIAAIADKIVADRSLINQQTGALAALAQLREQASQAAVDQAAMNALLPGQDALIGFAPWISKIASADGVSAQATFGSDVGNGSVSAPGAFGAKNMPFSLAASGPISNMVSFLDDIEVRQPGFLIQLTSFDLTYQSGAYQLNGQGQVFYR